jgi:histidine triad (HIT) family protein
MENCVFCKIIKGDLPREVIYEDDKVFVFPSNQPVADIHWLVVPKKHVPTFMELDKEVLDMTKVVQRLVKEKKLAEGYRLCFNGGKYVEVMHAHMHLLAGNIKSYT